MYFYPHCLETRCLKKLFKWINNNTKSNLAKESMVASSTCYSSCTKTLKSELGRRPEWTHLVAGRVIDAYIGPLLVASLRSRLSNGENIFSVARLCSLFGYGQCANTLNKKVLNCILLNVDTTAAISFLSLELNPMEQFQLKVKYQIKIEALLNSDTLS